MIAKTEKQKEEEDEDAAETEEEGWIRPGMGDGEDRDERREGTIGTSVS